MQENSAKQRQQRRAAHKTQRQAASRSASLTVLVVCEGRETEPNYVEALVMHLGISRDAMKVVRGGTKTNPASLVRKAQQLFSKEPSFDRVFVLCDGDAGGLEEARRLAGKRLKSESGIYLNVEVLVSTPSFEFWLLLHRVYTSAPLTTAEATERLRMEYPAYEKASLRTIYKIVEGLDQACIHASRLKQDLATSGASAPDTDMPKLVKILKSMKT